VAVRRAQNNDGRASFAQMLRKDVVGMCQRQLPHRSLQSSPSFTMSRTIVVRAWPENWMQHRAASRDTVHDPP